MRPLLTRRPLPPPLPCLELHVLSSKSVGLSIPLVIILILGEKVYFHDITRTTKHFLLPLIYTIEQALNSQKWEVMNSLFVCILITNPLSRPNLSTTG